MTRVEGRDRYGKILYLDEDAKVRPVRGEILEDLDGAIYEVGQVRWSRETGPWVCKLILARWSSYLDETPPQDTRREAPTNPGRGKR